MDDYPSRAYSDAVALLKLCYQSIDPEYRSRYRMDLWSQVEGKVRSSANTVSTLTAWVQRFLTFPHTEIRLPAALAAIISRSEPRAVLRLFREEPGVVVAFVRAELEAEREARDAERQTREVV